MKTIFDSSKIELVAVPEDKVYLDIRRMFDHSDYEIQRVFYEQYQRLNSAEFISLIRSLDNQTFGFLNLVDEGIANTLFLDIGVLQQFRNQQIGKLAITNLLENYQISKYLVAETQFDNLPAKHMLGFFGDSFYDEKDKIYYFLEGEKTCNDFVDDYAFEQLKEKAKVKSKSKFYVR